MPPNNNNQLYLSIKILIENARAQIIRNVNTTMVLTYYEIGRKIVENEQNGKHRADYSKKLLANLSISLTGEYGKGFSATNLEYIRKFYKTFSNRIPQSVIEKSKKSRQIILQGIPQSLFGKFNTAFSLSWTHYIQLIKIENSAERNFYEIEAANGNWSVRELQRQFNSSLDERLALSKDKKGVKELARKGQIVEKPADVLKHHTVLEFLDIKEDERYSESDLENAIISRLEKFMMEMGNGFLFEGRQKRLSFGGDSFYVDLVFYNRLLRCYVLLDLLCGAPHNRSYVAKSVMCC